MGLTNLEAMQKILVNLYQEKEYFLLNALLSNFYKNVQDPFSDTEATAFL